MWQKLSFLKENPSLILLFTIVLIPIVTLGYFLIYDNYVSRHDEEKNKNLQIAQLLAEHLDNDLGKIKASLQDISQSTSVQAHDRKKIEEMFSNMHLAQSEVSLYWITDTKGDLIA